MQILDFICRFHLSALVPVFCSIFVGVRNLISYRKINRTYSKLENESGAPVPVGSWTHLQIVLQTVPVPVKKGQFWNQWILLGGAIAGIVLGSFGL
jgi:hypothetical protein